MLNLEKTVGEKEKQWLIEYYIAKMEKRMRKKKAEEEPDVVSGVVYPDPAKKPKSTSDSGSVTAIPEAKWLKTSPTGGSYSTAYVYDPSFSTKFTTIVGMPLVFPPVTNTKGKIILRCLDGKAAWVLDPTIYGLGGFTWRYHEDYPYDTDEETSEEYRPKKRTKKKHACPHCNAEIDREFFDGRGNVVPIETDDVFFCPCGGVSICVDANKMAWKPYESAKKGTRWRFVSNATMMRMKMVFSRIRSYEASLEDEEN